MDDFMDTSGYREITAVRLGGSPILAHQGILAQLCGHFGHWNYSATSSAVRPGRGAGWVERHGPYVGAGAEGLMLVKLLAKLWGVNVSAGTGDQDISRAGFEGWAPSMPY
jgi:hypothetical protein